MVSTGSLIKGRSGLRYQLGKEIGNGGEGWVFRVENRPDLAVKIYKKEIPRQEEKVLYMVRNPIPDLISGEGIPVIRIAWPKDAVYDDSGKFVGYVMPFIDGGVEIFEVHRCCTSPKAKRIFPNYTWLLNVRVAHNLAKAVDYLHRYHCIIGDLNCKNILVDRNASIVFLDVDSFDITNRETGAHYKCTAGTEDYLPPELQGWNLHNERARFTTYTDDFALAIHIFQLLMDNYHPFSCVRRDAMKDSSNHNPRLEQIGSGSCPYVKPCPGYDVPISAPVLREVVPQYLIQDFRATFDYTDATVVSRIPYRTSAAIWARDLENLRWECENGGLVSCSQNPRHWYLRSIGCCGQCAAQKRFQVQLNKKAKPPTPPGPPKPPAPPETEKKKTKWWELLIAFVIMGGVVAWAFDVSLMEGLLLFVIGVVMAVGAKYVLSYLLIALVWLGEKLFGGGGSPVSGCLIPIALFVFAFYGCIELDFSYGVLGGAIIYLLVRGMAYFNK